SEVFPQAIYLPQRYFVGREVLFNPLDPAPSLQPPHPSPICHSDRSPAAFKKGVREAKKAKGAKKAKPFRLFSPFAFFASIGPSHQEINFEDASAHNLASLIYCHPLKSDRASTPCE